MTDNLTEVVGVVMIVRGGDRQYLPQYSFFEQMDTIQGSPITVLGEQQEFQLGTLLRSTYLNDGSVSFIQGIWGDQSVFNLSAMLFKQSEVTIRADDSVSGGSMLSSAVALSQGLWPPSPQGEVLQLANGTNISSPLGGYQYVAIESVDPSSDFTLTGAAGCMAWSNRVNQFASSDAYSEKANQSAQLLSQLQPYYPVANTSLNRIGDIYDYINTQNTLNATYANHLPPGYLEQARSLNDWLAYNMFTDSSLGGIGNIAGRSIMSNIYSALWSIVDAGNDVKVYIDVVSFEPFMSLMNMTGIFESGNLPPATVEYASAMVFELRRTSAGAYSVRLQLKNGTADDAFHTYPMVFGGWNGSLDGGHDVPLANFTDAMAAVMVGDWYTWCSACQNNVSATCVAANIIAQTQNGTSSGTSSSGVSSTAGALAVNTAHGKFSPVGAGFLGAGLAAVVLGAVFALLVSLGVFSYGGTRKLRRFSNASYQARKRRVGDELELHSEANSVIGLKVR